jgi:hypothetical protein
MSSQPALVAFGVIVLVGLIAGIWYAIRVWNSPNGERYMRRGIQGPFVPVDEEDIAAEKRRAQRKDP